MAHAAKKTKPVRETPTDKTSRHVYFAVPVSGSIDGFSGQYLRLEEYVSASEDPHLPDGLETTDLKGISISSTGYFLVNSKAGVHETYGKALTEAISGKDHVITIEKGDWTLVAEKGAITIETASKVAAGTMKFKSTDSDIVFKALNGKASTSDRFDVKTSTANAVTFVAGFEYSGVNGLVTKQNVGFVMNINVAGDVSIKVMDVKTEAFPFKYGTYAYNFLIASLKFQLIYGKFGVIDAKKMIVYNKITYWQIYNEIAKAEEKLVKDDKSLTNMEQKLAKTESMAAEVGMKQLIRM